MSVHDHEYREIITKAVCGSGRKNVKTTNHVLPLHEPTNILGCWIINHDYHAHRIDDSVVEVHGTYDINVWYSYEDETSTDVEKEIVDYCDVIELSNKDKHCYFHEDEVITEVIRHPNCLQCNLEDGRIAVKVEREFAVNVIGETKVHVKVASEGLQS